MENQSIEYTIDQNEWLTCLPNNLGNCFEMQFDSREPRRITGVVYEPGADFIEAIEALHKFRVGDGPKEIELCLNMAIHKGSGIVAPYFEFTNPSKGELIRLEVEGYSTHAILSPTRGSAKSHLGVSSNYKNELCMNWSALPYYRVNWVFYSSMTYDEQFIGSNSTQILKQPERVRKFIIPGTDLVAMEEVFKSSGGSHIKIIVHFGVSQSNLTRLGVPFNPVIEVVASDSEVIRKKWEDSAEQMEELFDDESTTSTFLDFVGACPPWCEDD